MSHTVVQTDFAAARAALDEAEREAIAAAVARAQAARDAAKAESDAFQVEIDATSGPWEPVKAARKATLDAPQRHQGALAAVQMAQAALDQARTALPGLVDQAVAGQAVTAEEVLAAHTGVFQAEQYVAFCSVVAGRHAALVGTAEAAEKVAVALAHEPVLNRGIVLRIEAGVAADATQSKLRPGAYDMAGLAEAKQIFDRANRLINHAVMHGVVFADGGLSTYWPTTEDYERRLWRRPALGAAS